MTPHFLFIHLQVNAVYVHQIACVLSVVVRNASRHPIAKLVEESVPVRVRLLKTLSDLIAYA